MHVRYRKGGLDKLHDLAFINAVDHSDALKSEKCCALGLCSMHEKVESGDCVRSHQCQFVSSKSNMPVARKLRYIIRLWDLCTDGECRICSLPKRPAPKCLVKKEYNSLKGLSFQKPENKMQSANKTPPVWSKRIGPFRTNAFCSQGRKIVAVRKQYVEVHGNIEGLPRSWAATRTCSRPSRPRHKSWNASQASEATVYAVSLESWRWRFRSLKIFWGKHSWTLIKSRRIETYRVVKKGYHR